jgi:hypothetical protein
LTNAFATCIVVGMATTEQDTTPEAPAAKETKAATREYIVLELEGSDTWSERGRADATTDKSAIDKVMGRETAGTYVGIPTRSFQPRTREMKPQPPKPVWS